MSHRNPSLAHNIRAVRHHRKEEKYDQTREQIYRKKITNGYIEDEETQNERIWKKKRKQDKKKSIENRRGDTGKECYEQRF